MAESRRTRIERDADPPVPEGAAVGAGLPSAADTRAAGEESGREPRFPVARILGAEGAAILADALADTDLVLPAGASEAAVLGGALHGVDGPLTRGELRQRVRRYLAHEDTTIQQEG